MVSTMSSLQMSERGGYNTDQRRGGGSGSSRGGYGERGGYNSRPGGGGYGSRPDGQGQGRFTLILGDSKYRSLFFVDCFLNK